MNIYQQRAAEIRARLLYPPNAFGKKVIPKEPLPFISIEKITSERIAMNVTLDFISSKFNVSIADILSQSRLAYIALARHFFCYLLVKRFKISQAKVSRFIVRDHTSVMSGSNRIAALLQLDGNEIADWLRSIEGEFIDLYYPAFAISSVGKQNLEIIGKKGVPQQGICRLVKAGRAGVDRAAAKVAREEHKRTLQSYHTSSSPE